MKKKKSEVIEKANLLLDESIFPEMSTAIRQEITNFYNTSYNQKHQYFYDIGNLNTFDKFYINKKNATKKMLRAYAFDKKLVNGDNTKLPEIKLDHWIRLSNSEKKLMVKASTMNKFELLLTKFNIVVLKLVENIQARILLLSFSNMWKLEDSKIIIKKITFPALVDALKLEMCEFYNFSPFDLEIMAKIYDPKCINTSKMIKAYTFDKLLLSKHNLEFKELNISSKHWATKTQIEKTKHIKDNVDAYHIKRITSKKIIERANEIIAEDNNV